MPKPRQTYISPKHVFDAELSKLPGSRKQAQRKELAKQLKYPVDYSEEEPDFLNEEDAVAADVFMSDILNNIGDK